MLYGLSRESREEKESRERRAREGNECLNAVFKFVYYYLWTF